MATVQGLHARCGSMLERTPAEGRTSPSRPRWRGRAGLTGCATHLTSAVPKTPAPFWRQKAVDLSSNVVLAANG